MVLKLHGAAASTCGKRVGFILHEKQIPFELVTVDWASGEHKTPAWLEKQPFGQVPYIDDDGFIVYESRAIARYLATKYADQGTPLLPDPSDLKALAILDQAISVEVNNFEPYACGITKEKVFKKYRGEEADPHFLSYYETSLKDKMDGFERVLSKQKYMAGDKITLVDFFYLPYGDFVTQLGYDYLTNEAKWPNVARWWKDITSRESYKAVKDGIPTNKA